MNSHLHTPRPGAQRGAATLIVVLLLFFIISLVAAYAGRNLIFEQKTSTNQYRATQAFEAAEAGLEWALAMLNGGSVTDACVPPVPADPVQLSFRARYLNVDNATGSVTPTLRADGVTAERPSCVQNGAGWNCSCPTDDVPTPAVPGGGGIHPAFRVCFERVPVDPLVPMQPGAVRIVSTGGTRFEGVVDQPCEQRGEGTDGEAAATVSVVVALASALPTPPSAGLTVRGTLDVTTDPMFLLPSAVPSRQVVDTDWMPNGWLAQVGVGPAANLVMARPENVHGTPIAALVAVDPALGNLDADQMFTSLFNMDPAIYKKQPATLVLNDCAAACSAKLLAAWQSNPGRILWVEGDMTIESNLILGCPANPADPVVDPVLVVATGNINLNAASVRVCGLLYSRAATWDNSGPNAVDVQGAAVAEGNFTGSGIGGGSPWVQYDADVLRRLSLGTGSFVRVPGSWRDFQ